MINTWTTAEGLPQNSANAIIQTRDGYLWIGTYGGLARFDGLTFTLLGGAESGLNSNRILALCESFDGSIWIGTEDGGLAKYQNDTWINYGKTQGLKDESIFALYEDSDSLLWIGTGVGVQCFKNGHFLSSPAEKIIHSPVRSLITGRKGALWVNADDGVYLIEKNSIQQISHIGPGPRTVTAMLLQEENGTCWFRSPKGLIREDGKEREITTPAMGLPHPYVTRLVRDSAGVYWAGTLVNGVGYGPLMPGRNFASLHMPSDKQLFKIQCCFVDREGNRWIGTDGNGLIRVKDRLIDVIGSKEGLKTLITEAVFEDSRGSIWIGTNDGGLYRSGKNKFQQVNRSKRVELQSVWSITEDKSGAIWVGTYGGGVWRYHNGKSKNFTSKNGLTGNDVLALYCDRSGAVWMGTERGGVTIFDHGTFKSITEKDGLSHSSVRTFLQDRSGTMWIGTVSGLNRYKDGMIKVYTTKEGLSHNSIRSLYEDGDGLLWIGTYGGGLMRFSQDKFTSMTAKDGLYDNVVSAILEDDNENLWMSCNRGIFRIKRRKLNAFAEGTIHSILCTAYGTESGMLSEETNGGFQPAAWKTRDGRLLFPTTEGVAVVHPSRIKVNTMIPPVRIYRFLVDQVEVPISSRLVLSPGKHHIEIGYAALSFSDPQHLKFKFKLDGLHTEWLDVKERRTAYFSNLTSGEYTFRVIASNNDGLWNTKDASLTFNIAEPFWETWPFRIAVFFSIVVLGYGIYDQRARRLKRSLEEQYAITRQLLDSTESERKRIATELHDSIGQELLIIKNRALLALGDLKDKKNVREQLDEISTTASHAIQETREITYNLRPYQLDRLGLRRAIESIIKRVSDTSQIKFTSDIDPIDGILAQDLEIHVYRIMQECINNILKHSNATTASLTIKHWHNRLHFDIKDNGAGFAHSTGKSRDTGGIGLHGIEERARILGGIVTIESTPGSGTRILITIKTHEKTNNTD